MVRNTAKLSLGPEIKRKPFIELFASYESLASHAGVFGGVLFPPSPGRKSLP